MSVDLLGGGAVSQVVEKRINEASASARSRVFCADFP